MNKKELYLARRYAAAFLFKHSESIDESLILSLKNAASILLATPRWHIFFETNYIRGTHFQKLVSTLIRYCSLPTVVERLALLLAEEKRIILLPLVLNKIIDLYDEKNNIERFVVESVMPLSVSQEQEIISALHEHLEKKIIITTRINPALIAGIAATSASHAFEYSVARQLSLLSHV
jgi:ATP synthase F1 delta subunit